MHCVWLEIKTGSGLQFPTYLNMSLIYFAPESKGTILIHILFESLHIQLI